MLVEQEKRNWALLGRTDAARKEATRKAQIKELHETFANGIYLRTPIQTPSGSVNIEALRPNDFVETFDHGAQRITRIGRARIADLPEDLPGNYWPVQIPAGMFENTYSVRIPPEQPILIESDTAEEEFGDPFLIVPSRVALLLPFVEQVEPFHHQEVYHLQFAEPELILGTHGTVCLCGTGSIFDDWRHSHQVETIRDRMNYSTLPYEYAREILLQDISRTGGIENYMKQIMRKMHELALSR